MKISLFITVSAIFALSLAPNLVLAPPPPAGATCNISCTVADIAEWSDTSSPTINLPELTAKNSRVSASPVRNSTKAGKPQKARISNGASPSLVLYTNADVKITANSSASALPRSPYGQRSKDDNHKLVTVYKLEYDTADTITVWSSYGSLLSNDSAVKHISADGAAELTLSFTVSSDTKAIGDSGEHSAALTLTACWKS